MVCITCKVLKWEKWCLCYPLKEDNGDFCKIWLILVHQEFTGNWLPKHNCSFCVQGCWPELFFSHYNLKLFWSLKKLRFLVIPSLSPTLTMTSRSQSYIHTVNNVETVNVIYLGWGENVKLNTMLSLLNIFLILGLVPCGTESWKCLQCLLNCTLLYWYK